MANCPALLLHINLSDWGTESNSRYMHVDVSPLDQNIKSLDFSHQFQDVCRNLDFRFVKDIVKFKASQLLAMDGFDERMFFEYLEYMRKIGLARQVRP